MPFAIRPSWFQPVWNWYDKGLITGDEIGDAINWLVWKAGVDVDILWVSGFV